MPSSLAITGKNGTGKSTLLKILAGLMSPTSGSVNYVIDGKKVGSEEFKHIIGFVSPYLNLYDEFTALENLRILSRIRNAEQRIDDSMEEQLTLAGLWIRKDDLVSTYSSGMKQRLKYAFALLHKPVVLILDEPTNSLDEEGIEFVRKIVAEQQRHGILVVATNNSEETGWCDKTIKMGMREL
jgi:heme exporter protein A